MENNINMVGENTSGLTKKWIKNQPCYYDDNFWIAEGYCDRKAAVIFERKYMCIKCRALKKKHKLQIWLSIFFVCLFIITGVIITHYSKLLGIMVSFLGGIILAYLVVDLDKFAFKHKGGVGNYNAFACRHCFKIFLNKDKKIFINHLKKEHSKEWKRISEKLQQLPNDKRVIKIELSCILKEHKKKDITHLFEQLK